MDARDRELGMNRDVSRRDFLNGVAVALTGAMVAPPWLQASGGVDQALAPEQAPDYYPPLRTGLRGSHPGSFETAHQLRDARSWNQSATDTGESYDLVVVGGGISGLAAAHFFREAAGRHMKILVLDNHDDFGGHAKRNEFRHEGRTFLLNGGTLNIEGPGQYSPQAMGLLRAIGIDIDRFEQETANDRASYSRLGLRNGVWFNKERFGVDRLSCRNAWRRRTRAGERDVVAGVPDEDADGGAGQDGHCPHREQGNSRTTCRASRRTRRSSGSFTLATRTFFSTSPRFTPTRSGSTRREATACS